MKREDLKAIEGLTEEQINAVMRLHSRAWRPSTAWTLMICAVRSPT